MALARTRSVALIGVSGQVVDLEADLSIGLPGFSLVGLPDEALSESRDRVRAALLNSGLSWPARRITVGLLPASLRKHGTHFDLALALAISAAAGELPTGPVAGAVVLGELGLDGRVRPVRGVLPAVLAAARAGVRRVVVPEGNVGEAALVGGVEVRGVEHLSQLAAWCRGQIQVPPAPVPQPPSYPPGPELADLVGQPVGRRAVEVAATGGHHLFLLGPPGAGKTMLAERLPGLLPPLDDDAALEVTAIHSVAGALPPGAPLLRRPPFQEPHHTASVAALVGGGAGLASPGALSLAHRGVLFLDEAPEFSPRALDSLRQPLERGEVVLARAHGVTRYPARCQLVLAANPCPCATAAGDHNCSCPAAVRRRYTARLSGPLLDRVDIQVELPPVRAAALHTDDGTGESTAVVAARVAVGRTAAADRYRDTPWRRNADVPGQAIRGRWPVPRRAVRLADQMLDRGELSLRGYERVMRVAWTIADLAGRTTPDRDDVHEALFLRLRHRSAA